MGEDSRKGGKHYGRREIVSKAEREIEKGEKMDESRGRDNK